jgi:hypothetical protein
MVLPNTYVYELIENDVVFYIGKTINPETRLLDHFQKYGNNIKMKIIDIFIDPEHKIILEYKEKGINLKNKEFYIDKDKTYVVGDIIEYKKKPNIGRIWDNKTQTEFPSVYSFAKYYGFSDYLVSSHLKGKSTKISKLLDIKIL